MAGYEAGSKNHVRYNNANWDDVERAAYRKGYADAQAIRGGRGEQK
jgi:hypothetical protein